MGQTQMDLGLRSHRQALDAVVGPVRGLDILDIGCGEAALSRALAVEGAEVIGIDPMMPPEPRQATQGGGFTLLAQSAGAVALPDASADLVLFIFSLHHIPEDVLPQALAEVARLLRPSGRLYVAEPLPEGPSHYVTAAFHDETAVRAMAQRMLDAHATPRFARRERLLYTDRRLTDGFEGYAARMIAARRFNGYSAEAVRTAEVQRRFAEMQARTPGYLDQPVRVDLFGG